MASRVHRPVEPVKEDLSVIARLTEFIKGLFRSIAGFIGIFFKALGRNRSGMAGFIGLVFILLMSTVGAYFIEFDDQPKLDQIGAPPGSRLQLVTRSEDADRFKTLDDLTGHTLGYIQRSGGEIFLEPYLDQDESPFVLEEFRFRSGRGIPEAIQALANGEIDALILFSQSVEQYMTNNRDASQGDQFSDLVVSNAQLGPVYLLGTDTQGRDIFSHIVHGGWKLIRVGLMAGFLSTLIAVTLGSLAALLGGPVDRLLVSIANFVLTIPQFPLLVVLAALIGPQLSNWLLLSLLIASLSWPVLMRAIRAQVLSLREREYVEAAISLGLGVRHIVFYEILPNLMSFVAINFIFAVIGAMYQQIGLIFLGMAAINDYTWGVMLYFGRTRGTLFSPDSMSMLLSPVLAIVVFQVSLVLFARALEEMFDPRLRTA
jgi:peptide/nickel transport system permease protein